MLETLADNLLKVFLERLRLILESFSLIESEVC
ncbi:MAG: hypothetical protein JWM99_2309 [Verrucomicrobiales bacterium]|nr:hypothetical protein [Verrucomicrobiales bacterium]